MFIAGSARKLQWKRCRSKGTDNEKQGAKSLGGFKGTKPMATWLGASQLQTCRQISMRLLNNSSATTKEALLGSRALQSRVLWPPRKIPGSCLHWTMEMHPGMGKGLHVNKNSIFKYLSDLVVLGFLHQSFVCSGSALTVLSGRQSLALLFLCAIAETEQLTQSTCLFTNAYISEIRHQRKTKMVFWFVKCPSG